MVSNQFDVSMIILNLSKFDLKKGIAGFYSMQALEDNMIGISMCNTSPIVFPTRSNSATFGTNPISLGKKCFFSKRKVL